MTRRSLSDSGCLHKVTAKKRHATRKTRKSKKLKRVHGKKPQTVKDININITVDLKECSNESSVNVQSKGNSTETNPLSNEVCKKINHVPIDDMTCGFKQTEPNQSTEQADKTNVSTPYQSQNKSITSRKRKRVSGKVKKLLDNNHLKKRGRKVKSKNSSCRKFYLSKKKKFQCPSKANSSEVMNDKGDKKSSKESCKMVNASKLLTNETEAQNKTYSCPAKNEIKDKAPSQCDVTSKPTNHIGASSIGIADKPSCNTTVTSKPCQTPILTPKDKSSCNISITNKSPQSSILSSKEKPNCNTQITKKLAESPILTPKDKSSCNISITNKSPQSPILSPNDKPICNTALTNKPRESAVLTSKDKPGCITETTSKPQHSSLFNSTSLCHLNELKPSTQSSTADKQCLTNSLSSKVKEESSNKSASKVSCEIEKKSPETSDQTKNKPCYIKNLTTPGVSSTERCIKTLAPCSSTSNGRTPSTEKAICDSIGVSTCPSKSITPSPCSTSTNTSVPCAPTGNNSTDQTKSETCGGKTNQKSLECTTSSDNKSVVPTGSKICESSPKSEDDICKCPKKETGCKENQSVFTEICKDCLKNKSNNNNRKKPVYKGLENQNLFGTPKTKIEKE